MTLPLFESPSYLWLLAGLPLVAALLVYGARRRQAAARRFVAAPMLARVAPQPARWRAWSKMACVLGGIACLMLAAARPQWGESLEEVQARGVDLFILLDVSRSMTAEDVAPSRLERAKTDIRDLLARLSGDRVGLILFAGAAVVRVPLTMDRAFVTSVLDEIDTEAAPRGGTLIGVAIRKALEAMPPESGRDQVLVLITDGEDHDSLPRAAAAAAAKRGVKIITVGLGDPGQGERIPVRDRQGHARFLQYDGQEVWSRMDEALLKEIALTTGGAYVPARTQAYDLGNLYEEHLADLTRGALSTTQRKRYRDQFQWFLAAGALLLLLDRLIPRAAQPSRPPRHT